MPKISELSPVGIREDKKQVFLQKFRNLPNSLIESNNCLQLIEALDIGAPQRKALSHFLFEFSGNVFKTLNDLFRDQNSKTKLPTATCAPFNRKIFLSATGKIYPCERIGQLFEYGNVSDLTVDIDFNKIADRHNEFYKKIKKQCFKCDKIKICTKCLLQMVNKDNNPICDEMLIQDDFIEKYFAMELSYLEREPFLFKHIWKNYSFE